MFLDSNTDLQRQGNVDYFERVKKKIEKRKKKRTTKNTLQ